jgi:hypothetical protein
MVIPEGLSWKVLLFRRTLCDTGGVFQGPPSLGPPNHPCACMPARCVARIHGEPLLENRDSLPQSAADLWKPGTTVGRPATLATSTELAAGFGPRVTLDGPLEPPFTPLVWVPRSATYVEDSTHGVSRLRTFILLRKTTERTPTRGAYRKVNGISCSKPAPPIPMRRLPA